MPIEPALRPLLAALVKNPLGTDGRLFVISNRGMGDTIRRHAHRAGIERPELFADDDQAMPLRFHSCRHTYATWLALAGVEALVIQQRGGWADFALVNRYVEEAESVGRGDIGTPFPPVPAVLVSGLVQSSRQSSQDSSKGPKRAISSPRNTVGGTGFEPATSGL